MTPHSCCSQRVSANMIKCAVFLKRMLSLTLPHLFIGSCSEIPNTHTHMRSGGQNTPMCMDTKVTTCLYVLIAEDMRQSFEW